MDKPLRLYPVTISIVFLNVISFVWGGYTGGCFLTDLFDLNIYLLGSVYIIYSIALYRTFFWKNAKWHEYKLIILILHGISVSALIYEATNLTQGLAWSCIYVICAWLIHSATQRYLKKIQRTIF